MLLYLFGIPPKGPNVILHPLECQVLVPEAQVGWHLVIFHREKPEKSQAVVDINQDHIFSLHDAAGTIKISGAITSKEATTMDPHHYWQRRRGDLPREYAM